MGEGGEAKEGFVQEMLQNTRKNEKKTPSNSKGGKKKLNSNHSDGAEVKTVRLMMLPARSRGTTNHSPAKYWIKITCANLH